MIKFLINVGLMCFLLLLTFATVNDTFYHCRMGPPYVIVAKKCWGVCKTLDACMEMYEMDLQEDVKMGSAFQNGVFSSGNIRELYPDLVIKGYLKQWESCGANGDYYWSGGNKENFKDYCKGKSFRTEVPLKIRTAHCSVHGSPDRPVRYEEFKELTNYLSKDELDLLTIGIMFLLVLFTVAQCRRVFRDFKELLLNKKNIPENDPPENLELSQKDRLHDREDHWDESISETK